MNNLKALAETAAADIAALVNNALSIINPETGELTHYQVKPDYMRNALISVNALANSSIASAPPDEPANRIPQGFVEFALQVMREANRLRAAGVEPASVAYGDSEGVAHWFDWESIATIEALGESPVSELVTIAANALLLAVEERTIDG